MAPVLVLGKRQGHLTVLSIQLVETILTFFRLRFPICETKLSSLVS